MVHEAMTELLTPTEVAALLKCSKKSVIRRFEKVAGVVDLGTAETKYRQGRKILRIPRPVLERFLSERSCH